MHLKMEFDYDVGPICNFFFSVTIISGISLIVVAVVVKWLVVPAMVNIIVWDKMELVEGTLGYQVSSLF